MSPEDKSSSGGMGLPYIVILRQEDDRVWGTLTALNPSEAVREVRDRSPAAARPGLECEVYPVGVAPDGGTEHEIVTSEDVTNE